MDCKDYKFDFDDILIVPKVTTTITSRYNGIELPANLPLIAAPMDTVVDMGNMDLFSVYGIKVCLPRTISYEDYYNHNVITNTVINSEENLDVTFPSVGLNEIEWMCKSHPQKVKRFKNILIDVANGHMEIIMKHVDLLKETNPNIKVMVGNIANPRTYEWYARTGLVDYVRVGIGNGGGCLTTKQSGIGYPMASLIYETRQVKEKIMCEDILDIKKNYPAIVADGGMKDYSDVVKALGLGADFVMLGSIFNKALESCADNYFNGKKIDKEKAEKLFKEGKIVQKYFRGMSTKEAQKAMGKSSLKTSEGVVRYRDVEYTLGTWVENFQHYLRNAMSYTNCKTLPEFIGGVDPILITKSAYDRFNK